MNGAGHCLQRKDRREHINSTQLEKASAKDENMKKVIEELVFLS